MKLNNVALAKIFRWIEEDFQCCQLLAKITKAQKDRKEVLNAHYVAHVKMLFTCERNVKKVNYQLSVKDRRQQVIDGFRAYAKEERLAWLKLRKDLRHLDSIIAGRTLVLGKRRGYLRQTYQAHYIVLQQKELNRIAGRKQV